MRRRLLNTLLYFPDPAGVRVSPPADDRREDVWFQTRDGERLHGWRVAGVRRPFGHVLFCHGNAGSVVDRLPYARLLADAGLDVLLFDYRGYGRSTGHPSEEGTYADARAAREALLAREGVEPDHLLYLGESLGGAVAARIAVEHAPAGLILQSAFTSVRDVARLHYPFIPRAVVPDAYPTLRLIRDLRAPLLVLHSARDEIVPLSHGQALHAAAPEPKRLHVFPHSGHADLLGKDGREWLTTITTWARDALSW